VLALLAGREGNVWIGTADGLDRFSEPSLKAPLDSAENLKVFPTISNLLGVAPADDAGGLWVTNGLECGGALPGRRMSPPHQSAAGRESAPVAGYRAGDGARYGFGGGPGKGPCGPPGGRQGKGPGPLGPNFFFKFFSLPSLFFFFFFFFFF